MEDYYKVDAINASLLKAICKQSAHHADISRNNVEPSPSMNLGSAVHALILEPDKFEEQIAIAPKGDRRTKIGKEAYKEFEATVGNQRIITAKQYDDAKYMSESFFRHPEATELLKESGTFLEEEIYWQDSDQYECKAKIDMGCVQREFVADIKTTMNAHPSMFRKASTNYMYHVQLAWYAHAMGFEPKHANAYIIAIENVKPYATVVYKYTPEALEFGWNFCQRALQLWKEYQLEKALEKENVLAYSNEVWDIDVPNWAKHPFPHPQTDLS